MKKYILVIVSVFLFIFPALACQESNQPEPSGLRVLYTVPAGSPHSRLSLLSHQNSSRPTFCGNDFCKGQKVNGELVICPDRLIHLETGEIGHLSKDQQRPRDAALGEGQRIAYVLDKKGDIHVLDTQWSHQALADLPLLFWTPESGHVEIVAGNAKRVQGTYELQGKLTMWTVHENSLFLLHTSRTGEIWTWGIDLIDLENFDITEVVFEETDNPANVPTEITIEETGRSIVLKGTLTRNIILD